jgi:hypothetical protein
MLAKKTPELPLAETEPTCQTVDIGLVQSAQLDQGKRARHRIRRPTPCAQIGRRLRAASQAGAETCFLCRRRRRKENDVPRMRRARRTNRAAVDTGGFHSREETAVEARIAQAEGAVTSIMIEVHAGTVVARPDLV